MPGCGFAVAVIWVCSTEAGPDMAGYGCAVAGYGCAEARYGRIWVCRGRIWVCRGRIWSDVGLPWPDMGVPVPNAGRRGKQNEQKLFSTKHVDSVQRKNDKVHAKRHTRASTRCATYLRTGPRAPRSTARRTPPHYAGGGWVKGGGVTAPRSSCMPPLPAACHRCPQASAARRGHLHVGWATLHRASLHRASLHRATLHRASLHRIALHRAERAAHVARVAAHVLRLRPVPPALL